MRNNQLVLSQSPTVPSSDPVSVSLWLASQVQAGIWAVFLLSAVVVFLTRKRVSKALDSHFALMESMKNAIEVNAENQTRNASSQEQLTKVLSEMEITDAITRKDVEEIKRTQAEILEYVSGVPRRSLRSQIPRYHIDSAEGEVL